LILPPLKPVSNTFSLSSLYSNYFTAVTQIFRHKIPSPCFVFLPISLFQRGPIGTKDKKYAQDMIPEPRLFKRQKSIDYNKKKKER